ncbi:transposase [Endozoicomonas gorgoniicola]|uniref:Transposase n=1 Tax=Endozoicomonas gorgoniicola TaxID=1234144 RepID=A0ABT3MWW5_9GAMM|nr:transposase [Endozoicomonas gorgoniicola]MCW7553875.1 transposase [Endozoicomonas gorgoniicola]
MAEKRRRKSNYSPEFMDKAVDIALASILPDKEVARLLGVNASTLATWKGKRARMIIGPQQPQEAMSFEIEEEQDAADVSDNESFDASPYEASDEPIPPQPDASSQDAPSQHEDVKLILNDVAKLIPEEINQLRRENLRLKNEKDVLQEALIILAGSYLRA